MKTFLKVLTILLFFSMRLFSTSYLDLKSRAGISYALGISPTVDGILNPKRSLKLSSLHRASLFVEVPYNRYLMFGFSFDFTLALSPLNKNPRLTMSGMDSGGLYTILLGLSGMIKPQYPISLSFGDLILYSALQLGFGGNTPITFGAQPLSLYGYQETSNIPSPFPLYLENALRIGAEYFLYDYFGFDLSFGHRILWVIHPMVNAVGGGSGMDIREEEDRIAVCYDISSLSAMLSFKLAL